jgi:hypothetical protein
VSWEALNFVKTFHYVGIAGLCAFVFAMHLASGEPSKEIKEEAVAAVELFHRQRVANDFQGIWNDASSAFQIVNPLTELQRTLAGSGGILELTKGAKVKVKSSNGLLLIAVTVADSGSRQVFLFIREGGKLRLSYWESLSPEPWGELNPTYKKVATHEVAK